MEPPINKAISYKIIKMIKPPDPATTLTTEYRRPDGKVVSVPGMSQLSQNQNGLPVLLESAYHLLCAPINCDVIEPAKNGPEVDIEFRVLRWGGGYYGFPSWTMLNEFLDSIPQVALGATRPQSSVLTLFPHCLFTLSSLPSSCDRFYYTFYT